ncbi:MAG TPA: uracil-DNA glycosylase [Gallionella sp.]|nr:uracil-DNA glycosylase [Gallionella sp.]
MNTSPLSLIVERIRSEKQLTREVPGFDPKNGNEKARFLFVLEAPGPMAVDSGVISLDNKDQTAINFRTQLDGAGVKSSDIALWNVVPWYLGKEDISKIRGARSTDVKQGLQYLTAVVAAIENLQCIILVGGAARKAHIHLSHNTTARILSCHHPSPKVQNTVAGAAKENVEVFRFMLRLSK